MSAVDVGHRVPEFAVTAHDGTAVSPAALRGAPWVLFFYPRDDSPVCTREACAFRDAWATFTARGIRVIGVSADSDERHHAFAARHRLPFPLISDPAGALRRLFGVPRVLGLLDGRVTYVVDAEGIVRHRTVAMLDAERHVEEALATLAR